MKSFLFTLILAASAQAQFVANEIRLVPFPLHAVVPVFKLYDLTGNFYIGFKPRTSMLGANQLFTLPQADGNASDVLTTNGSKVLSFGPPVLTAPYILAGSSASPILTLTQSGAGPALSLGGLLAVTGSIGTNGSPVTGSLFVLNNITAKNDFCAYGGTCGIADATAGAQTLNLTNSVGGACTITVKAGIITATTC